MTDTEKKPRSLNLVAITFTTLLAAGLLAAIFIGWLIFGSQGSMGRDVMVDPFPFVGIYLAILFVVGLVLLAAVVAVLGLPLYFILRKPKQATTRAHERQMSPAEAHGTQTNRGYLAWLYVSAFFGALSFIRIEDNDFFSIVAFLQPPRALTIVAGVLSWVIALALSILAKSKPALRAMPGMRQLLSAYIVVALFQLFAGYAWLHSAYSAKALQNDSSNVAEAPDEKQWDALLAHDASAIPETSLERVRVYTNRPESGLGNLVETLVRLKNIQRLKLLLDNGLQMKAPVWQESVSRMIFDALYQMDNKREDSAPDWAMYDMIVSADLPKGVPEAHWKAVILASRNDDLAPIQAQQFTADDWLGPTGGIKNAPPLLAFALRSASTDRMRARILNISGIPPAKLAAQTSMPDLCELAIGINKKTLLQAMRAIDGYDYKKGECGAWISHISAARDRRLKSGAAADAK